MDEKTNVGMAVFIAHITSMCGFGLDGEHRFWGTYGLGNIGSGEHRFWGT